MEAQYLKTDLIFPLNQKNNLGWSWLTLRIYCTPKFLCGQKLQDENIIP